MKIVLILCMLAVVGLPAGGCMSLKPASTEPREPSRTGDVGSLLVLAQARVQEADTRQKLASLIDLYETALEIDPRNQRALARLAEYHVLLGAGYSDDIEQKKEHFTAAIAYSERIMYLNDTFKARVESGKSLWQASEVLTNNEVDGMGWWTTAVFYYFKECIPDVYKIFNAKWIKRNKIFMDRIEAVAPDWMNGANYFNLGIYYLAIPESFGGDLDKSAAYIEKATSTGPKRLLFPWGRAKYFYYNQKNQQAFERDLEWVLAQDPHQPTGDGFPWNVYFQSQARNLLASADELF